MVVGVIFLVAALGFLGSWVYRRRALRYTQPPHVGIPGIVVLSPGACVRAASNLPDGVKIFSHGTVKSVQIERDVIYTITWESGATTDVPSHLFYGKDVEATTCDDRR